MAMVVADWMSDVWLKETVNDCCLYAYVDDWTCTFPDTSRLDQVWESISNFVEVMDLELDLKKSCCWSARGTERQALADAAVQKVLKVRMLGVHQDFCLRPGNATLTSRVEGMSEIWKRLHRSLSPYRFKLISLIAMAWPRALHGVSIVHLGQSWIRMLRTGARKGLRACISLAKPLLQTTIQTIKDARAFGSVTAMETVLGLLSCVGHGLPYNGPTTVLRERLGLLSWVVHGSGMVRDTIGLFSLFHCSFEEVWLRFRIARPNVLWEATKHRSTFDGLHMVDVMSAQALLQDFGDADQVFARCHLDGTLYTQNGRAKFQVDTDDRCQFCSFIYLCWKTGKKRIAKAEALSLFTLSRVCNRSRHTAYV